MSDPSPPDPQTPSQAAKQGKCPSCLGKGRVFRIILDEEGDCSSCGGSGELDDVFKRLE